MNWQPRASLEIVERRARLLEDIRVFFATRSVLEVDTPVLSRAAPTDPHIDSLQTAVDGWRESHYLHTSPEFPMKRLLAAYGADIYQICKVFRQGEVGKYHNPEFTLLEWYRMGFDHYGLMREVDELLAFLVPDLAMTASVFISYKDAFASLAGVDSGASFAEIKQSLPNEADLPEAAMGDKDACLDWLMVTKVAPKFSKRNFTYVYDYPSSQASLAQVRSDDDDSVAERFEVYWGEVELANGFHELRDPVEQRARFSDDCERRIQAGQAVPPVDEHLLAALHSGLPDCAGVALGLDRLLMAALRVGSIADILTFPIDYA